jgi:tripartite-type tricarboxylate transporter receptor subunit TctC
MKSMTTLFAHVLASSLVLLMATASAAEAYPSKTIRLIVPFAAGGGTDLFARAVCDTLTVELKQTCIVESKPGAGTAIGNSFVSHSAPDGYNLLLTTSSFSIVPALNKGLTYGGVDAFSPVALLGETANVFVVRTDSPYKTFQDFIAAAKQNPGKRNYGSSGVGSTTHLAGELLASQAALDIIHVPYKGAGPLITDVLGSQVEMGVSSITSAMPFISDGRVRALAVSTAKRSARLPDVPTLNEAGVKGFDVAVWYALFAPPKTPKSIVMSLNKALLKLPQNPRFSQWAEREGVTAAHSTPEQLGQRAREDEARWRELAKARNIRID